MKRIVNMSSLTLITAFLATLLILLPCNASAQKPIKVGVIDTYSGPPAVFADDALNGFKLALDEINKKGVLGRKIEFTPRDDKWKVDVGLSVAKELVMREEVDVIVGTINSSVTMAISDYMKSEKVPFIVWISKSEHITGSKGHRYVFSTGENSAMAGKAGGGALAKKPWVKYWIGGGDYEYGHALADAIWRNLKAQKPRGEKIWETGGKKRGPGLLSFLTSLMGAKPDAFIF